MTDLFVIDQGTGMPIVWIHGFPLSSLIFEQQLLMPGVRHLAPDLPGFGESAPAAIDSMEDYAVALLSMLDEKGIGRAVLAGVSMGGYVVLSLVRRRPELAAGLILIDTKEGADGAEGRANRFAQIDRVEAEGPGFFIGEMMPKMLTAPTLRLDDRRAEIVKQAMNRASAAGVQSALRAMASRPDSSDVLRSFDRPVLVVVGREDVITPLPDANRMASLAPRSTLVEIPDAAHLSNVERPEVFNTSAAAFIENLQ